MYKRGQSRKKGGSGRGAATHEGFFSEPPGNTESIQLQGFDVGNDQTEKKESGQSDSHQHRSIAIKREKGCFFVRSVQREVIK